MSAMIHEFDLSQATMLPPIAKGRWSAPGVEALSAQWDAVHEAAAAVACLAQLGSAPAGNTGGSLPSRAAELGNWRYDMVARAVDDLAAIMRPGLRALLALTATGKDTTAAALTLWREFHKARAAILALVD